MVSTLISLPGYRISEEIYNGSRTQVYRGYRDTDFFKVVIKLLKNPYPSFSELVQFRNQYTIAKNLNSPLIVQTYSLEPLQNGYALVMEDFGGISLKDYFTNKNNIASLDEFLQIAIALCDTLDILYRNRIIHKDIKPANILINPETKQVKLIDFSIASLLPRETQILINPNVLEGTLAYISPEQTGRMNRGIDYRTDFYSLGVTFYELLTGELPFQSNDPMEMVHCHIAKELPRGFGKGAGGRGQGEEIPQVISDIVMKLMAKNAEDRYQSALGLKFDLENCLTQLRLTGIIESFAIAQRDVCDRFIIPDKLYGRETEVETLLQAFERVSQGATEIMLVAGFSGVGKTAVVNEVHKPIVRQHGYFIKGKYDQFQRNIPFSAFVQAFRDLMGQLLTLSDVQIQQWKNKILLALGENAQVIIEVIPELSRIIGEQSSAPELSEIAAQNRFNLLFQKFTKVFTSAEHPLVMFLDDLQWADSASLNLMQLLMTDTSHLLLIGAYRDNEVNPAHPLILTLSDIQKTQAAINTITLAPLNHAQVNQLVANTLKCTENLALPLAKLIYQKTQGNPFFATQFLKALHQEQLIEFNFKSGFWQCDIARVTQQAVTDDVVEFMALQLRKLPPSTQHILQLAACIGSQFDLATLAIVSQHSEIEIAGELWKALQEGLILPISEVYKFYVGQESQIVTPEIPETVTYKFLHDRVQQAAYSLIPEAEKQITHLQIGRLLQKATSVNELDKQIFAIANHLNKGISLIEDETEQQELVQLNLMAGQKAKGATAYGAALDYFNTGISLLKGDCWQNHYTLALVLYEGAANCAFLYANFEQMEQFAEIVLAHARSWLDRINVYDTKIRAYMAQNQLLEALELARKVLEPLGVHLPEQPTPADIGQALQHTQIQLSDRAIESLLHLPPMTAPDKKAAMMILSTIMSPAYQAAPNLMPLVVFAQFDLSVQYGNSSESIHAYGLYGLMLIAILGNIEAGYCFGQLEMKLLQYLQSPKHIAAALFDFNCFFKHWKEPAKTSLAGLLQAYTSALEVGDFNLAALSLLVYDHNTYFTGGELSDLKQILEDHRRVMQQLRQHTYLHTQSLYHQVVVNLLGESTQPEVLIGEYCDEREMIQLYQKTGEVTALHQVYLNKLILCYLFQHYEQALENANLAAPYLRGMAGLMSVPLFYFYDALVQLALYANASETEQSSILERVAANLEKLNGWTAYASSNQAHRCTLIVAERCRVLEDRAKAIENYDRAIALAKKHEYINEEALANELATKFYLEWGKERIAKDYLIAAYYAYSRWGAKAKVTDLEQRYPRLLQLILQQQRLNPNPQETLTHGSLLSTCNNSTDSTNISDVLDFTSALKAAQAISSTLELNTLIASLTRIILENSGARKAVLLLPQEQGQSVQVEKSTHGLACPLKQVSGDIWQVRAITFIQHEEIETSLRAQPLDNCPDIPVNIINYVKNTQNSVVIDNCKTDIPGLIGQYMLLHQPQSVFCTPIINQGHFLGILYLENKMIPGVFNSDRSANAKGDRLSVINLLSSQAAISLENAQLYQQTGQALQDLQQAQLQIVQSEKMSALGNLVAGVAHEMNNPLGFIYASLQQAKPSLMDIIEHLKLYQENFPNPGNQIINHAQEIDLDYSLEDLPKMIDSMNMACDRLTNISTSLRTFSRADKDYKVPFNIHEGIDSTILILKHRLKANAQRPAIEVITNYGELPQVKCFPGQLNQVFMNILANAIDALDESNIGRSLPEIKANPNQITIKTFQENEGVKIAITDNGKGMSEEVQQKIFDHLFTTKAVGKGTGLGLAIARQIVEETHAGKLSCNSVLGEGTEFLIEIPV
ncbi:trifunctional serine/threonine-protein kinase/ATP-binding protein/sensor histidine kinase [Halotia branconii]|uniref:histidine kinase n=1 Tax=Halotia branconii CENA392 TaxID=1539056 RepID=A0AAJ6NV84_9CYAN|nr:ATP-binding sensor histidine kinase [Halotia branconii]WGV27355.1 trifunctional serine/threonine-protein kinase/ATP-binding protein/sensor histidine kinase [Halotia branconii CENA392]